MKEYVTLAEAIKSGKKFRLARYGDGEPLHITADSDWLQIQGLQIVNCKTRKPETFGHVYFFTEPLFLLKEEPREIFVAMRGDVPEEVGNTITSVNEKMDSRNQTGYEIFVFREVL